MGIGGFPDMWRGLELLVPSVVDPRLGIWPEGSGVLGPMGPSLGPDGDSLGLDLGSKSSHCLGLDLPLGSKSSHCLGLDV